MRCCYCNSLPICR